MSGTRASWGPAMGDFRADGVGRLLCKKTPAWGRGRWGNGDGGRPAPDSGSRSAIGDLARADRGVDEIQAAAVGQAIDKSVVERVQRFHLAAERFGAHFQLVRARLHAAFDFLVEVV